MDAYQAIINLHNSGHQLMALAGNQVATCPALGADQEEMIRAIRAEPAVACMAIQRLPQLCLIIFPPGLLKFACDLFCALIAENYVQLLAIRYCRSTGATEWVYVPTHSMARRTMLEILDFGWKGVEFFECKTERQCG